MTAPTTVVAPDRSVFQHLSSLWEYRELLSNLVRKELKVRYKNSALGFAWSLLNPIMQMIIYTVIFQVLLGVGIPYFPIWLLSGALAWNLFSGSLLGATQSITGNASLVNKVWFPREILPLATVGANLVHYVLQSLVLVVTIAISPINFDWRWVWLVIPAVIVLLLLTAAGAVFFSCVNVYARDTQHLLELLLMAWFWLTPILYAWYMPAEKLHDHGFPSWLVLLNPLASVTLALQRGLYGRVVGHDGVQMLPFEGQLWYLRNLGLVAAVATVLLVLALKLFSRLEGNFAEQL